MWSIHSQSLSNIKFSIRQTTCNSAWQFEDLLISYTCLHKPHHQEIYWCSKKKENFQPVGTWRGGLYSCLLPTAERLLVFSQPRQTGADNVPHLNTTAANTCQGDLNFVKVGTFPGRNGHSKRVLLTELCRFRGIKRKISISPKYLNIQLQTYFHWQTAMGFIKASMCRLLTHSWPYWTRGCQSPRNLLPIALVVSQPQTGQN